MAPLDMSDFETGKDPETSVMPITTTEKMRYALMAKDLEDQRMQAFIEANFGIQALKLLKAVVPLIAAL